MYNLPQDSDAKIDFTEGTHSSMSVCLSIRLCGQAITSDDCSSELHFLECRYILTISRSSLSTTKTYLNVMTEKNSCLSNYPILSYLALHRKPGVPPLLMKVAGIITDELQVTQLGLKLGEDIHEIQRTISGT